MASCSRRHLSFFLYKVISPKYQAAAAAPAKMHKVMRTFAQAGMPVAYGSFKFIFGNFATSVKVLPNGMLILAAAFTAQPLAFKSGAMLRRRHPQQHHIAERPLGHLQQSGSLHIQFNGLIHKRFQPSLHPLFRQFRHILHARGRVRTSA